MVHHFQALRPATEPVCSVCIANYNGAKILPDCIDSILAQAGDIPMEIIVHDDASSDGSAEWIQQRYPNVELLVSGENVGFCIANNRMTERARGRYLLLLNNDAALHTDALKVFLEESQRQSIRSILTLPQYDWETNELIDRGCLLDPLHVPAPNFNPERAEIAFVIGACLWISREDWQVLGGFPEWMDSVGEDLYLCCAARLQGWSIRCLPSSGYRHRQGASFGGNHIGPNGIRTRYRRRHLSERNRLAAFIACTPTMFMWPWLILQLTMLLLEGAALSLALRSTRPWRDIYIAALRDIWQRGKEILALRRSLQTNRTCTLSDYLRAFTPWPRKLIIFLRNGTPRIS
ncbi:glycosyltransferase family 2 protein [Stenotrophomonas nitritireducens]|uniref:Glycosyl transferase n=1 Tax=Stenotrophomonas nitritireducens TaxID=83617 RepID=A0ABR5NGF7_9GAMM|nr:glycosyltransferase [Stenotrophomonas nitritireducens]KRG54784.1 glycosyl transferase [Stenotrophomonas nitritireducens]